MLLVSAEYKRNAGLGNKLFPWSRARIFSEEQGIRMLEPVWFSPRAAAITRGGVDYRKAFKKIWLFDNFRSDRRNLSQISGFLRMGRMQKVFLKDLNDPNCIDIKTRDNTHYIFAWGKEHNFKDLQPYRSFLLSELREITQKKNVEFAEKETKEPFIALNIRTGKDFVSKTSGKNGYYLTEIDWFIEALNTTRKNYGKLPALIISDGGLKQLEKILRYKATYLVNSPSAISDLLILTKAQVLLGSGNSSFSAWASFLGGMDTFSSPETPFDHFEINCPSPKVVQKLHYEL